MAKFFKDLPEIKLAQKIIAQYNYSFDTLPVNIEQIIKDHNIILREESLPGDVSGVLDTRKKPIILVCKKDPPVRKRFTMAHELGHFLFHARQPSVYMDTKTFFRNSISSEGKHMEEKQANRFASELLMPTNILLNVFDENTSFSNDSDDEDIIHRLADKFEVSISAFVFKLHGVLKAQRF